MPFTLHTSNKTENLLEHLAMVMGNPLPSPFDKEVFLIQSQGMERWLLQGLSQKFGVMANYQLLFPNRFFNEIAQKVCATKGLKPDTFARERLVWSVDAVLREVVEENFAEFAAILSYLKGEQADRKRFQLAQQLTQLFDQYQVFRPDWMDEAYPSHWSLKIWRRVLDKIGDRKHIGQAWQTLITQLEQGGENVAQALPKRISVFGVNSMPVVFVQVLQALAKHTDVHVYVTQPTEGYWGDLRSRSEVKRDKIQRVFVDEAAEIDPNDINHPLLSLLGQQGRDFHSLLVEHAQFDWEYDSFEDQANSALEQLQNQIRLNQAPTQIAVDESIECVSCHSRMREMQVLKDFLLKTLQANPELQLRDIVVMAPKIADYEPFIETVFHDKHLPTAIADKGAREGNEVIETYMVLLNLLGGRFEWTEVMDLVEREPIKQHLKLTERDVDQLRAWVDQTHTRWGQSAEHKAQLGLPALNQNTWDAGLKQMMLGFAMQDQTVSIEGSQAQLMAKLYGLVRSVLFKYSKRTSFEKTPYAWSQLLSELLDTLFDAQNSDAQPLRNALTLLGEIETDVSYDLNAVMAWLDEALAEQKSSQGFMAGQLTFCSMLPMRSIPFKVVCVLGLNEGEFPRQDRRPSFDLMADDFQPGDRSARIDDRYQFLEVILSARERLYLSYVGQSQYKPQDIPPSVVLQELLDELSYEDKKFPVKHPLQAFSVEYFKSDSALRTFDKQAQKTALALQEKSAQEPVWFKSDSVLPECAEREIELSDFLFFATNPQKWFVQKRLNLKLSQANEEGVAHELFDVSGLDQYAIEQEVLESLVKGQTLTQVHQRLMDSGQWPSGAMGELHLTETLSQVDEMAQAIAELDLGQAQEPFWAEVRVGDWQLDGAIGSNYEGGFLLARYSRLKPKDYVRAALIQALTSQTVHLMGLDGERKFKHIVLSHSLIRLDAWLEAYAKAHQAPSAYWPVLGWAWLDSFHDPKKKNKSEDDKTDAAQKAVKDAFEKLKGEGFNNNFSDEYVVRLTQGQTLADIWTGEAEAFTLDLLTPIHELTREAKS